MDIGTIVAGILTLCILSFLYRDNPIYKMAETLLIGVSIGYTLVIVWSTTLVDILFEPLFSESKLALIIPFVLGLLVMLEARTLKQMSATVMPLISGSGWPDISALVVMVGVVCTLTYFYFSREHKGVLGKSARLGTYFLMIFFGTTFGFTVMSRMSTFIGRMEFLLTDFLIIK
jgi:hypothetical protein